MTLVTVETYQRLTKDFDSAADDVEAALDEALGLLQEELQRPLEQAVRTERMLPDNTGRLYPDATPLVSVQGSYQLDGATLVGGSPFPQWTDFIQGTEGVMVTYVGGWVERSANPLAANRLPVCIERDVCFAAWHLLRPALDSEIPSNASSVRLGDASLTFDRSRAPSDDVSWSRRTLRYRRAGKRVPGPSWPTEGVF